MLIQEYSTYKIWESDQKERELRLSRLVSGVNASTTNNPRLGWWSSIVTKLTA
jgi:hypothetical protein